MAACGPWAFDRQDLYVSGRLLSLYETSDSLGVSCAPLSDRRSPSFSNSGDCAEPGARPRYLLPATARLARASDYLGPRAGALGRGPEITWRA